MILSSNLLVLGFNSLSINLKAHEAANIAKGKSLPTYIEHKVIHNTNEAAYINLI